MRLKPFLLAAAIALFARPTTSDEHNVPAQRFLQDGAETNKEERAWSLLSFDKVIKLVKPLKPSWLQYLKISGKTADDAFIFMGLKYSKKPLDTNEHFKAWVRYVRDSDVLLTSGMKTAQKYLGSSGLLAMFVINAKDQADAAVINKLEKPLLDFWKAKNKIKPRSASEVFTELQFNKIDDHTAYKTLLNTWFKHVKYLKTSENDAKLLEEMRDALSECDEYTRLSFFAYLSEIDGTMAMNLIQKIQ